MYYKYSLWVNNNEKAFFLQFILTNALHVSWNTYTIDPKVKSTLSKFQEVKRIRDHLHTRFALFNGPTAITIYQLRARLVRCFLVPRDGTNYWFLSSCLIQSSSIHYHYHYLVVIDPLVCDLSLPLKWQKPLLCGIGYLSLSISWLEPKTQ